MKEELPRQTYRSAEDAKREEGIAQAFALWGGASYLKIGADKRDAPKPRVDRLLYRGERAVCFFEAKYCRYEFGAIAGWTVSERKVLELRRLRKIICVPCYFVVRFGCGSVAYLDAESDYEPRPAWGRTDRDDDMDIETGARFAWAKFRVL